MKNFLAIGLACVLPSGFAAEEPGPVEANLGTVSVLVIEDATATHMACMQAGDARNDCMSFNQALLTAHTRKVSALHERGRWI